MGKKMYEQNDNTSVRKPITQQFFTRKAPSQEEQQEMAKQGYNWDGKNWRYVGTISDKGGKPSTDTRTAEQKNKDYWSLRGAGDRWSASWINGTNPVKGALDNGLGYANPVTAVANTAYDVYNAYDQLSSPQGLAKTWGLFKQGKLGKAAVSAAGDVLAASDLIPGMPETPNIRTTQIPEIRVRHTGEFTGETVIPPMNITDNPIDMTNVRQQSNTLQDHRVAPTREELSNSAPSGPFENQLQYLINNITNEQDRRILQEISEGNWGHADYLWGNNYYDLAQLHPDSRFLNRTGRGGFQQIRAIQQVRSSLNDGLLPPGHIVEYALGTNPYDDNPLIQELGNEFSEGYAFLPASLRPMFEQPWNPANNYVINDLLNSGVNYIVNYEHPYNNLSHQFRRNAAIPLEYRHINTEAHYDGSYPIEYYTGTTTPDGYKDKDQLLKYGFLGDTPGMFSNEELSNLSQKAFDDMYKRSDDLAVEGAFISNGWDGTPEKVLRALLEKGSEGKNITGRLSKSQKAGYVNLPHSLSIDSWPIWELQTLRQLDKTNIIPTNLLKGNREFNYRNTIKNGVPYGVTNLYGLHNRINASKELLDYIRKNKGLTTDDFNINTSDQINFDVLHNGTIVGSFKMLNEQETLDKFNAVRRRLYQSRPELYPGDAVHNSGFRFSVPYIPTQLKKQGGKLNAGFTEKINR